MAHRAHFYRKTPRMPLGLRCADGLPSFRMPSQLHEALLQLFRNRPSLATELLRDTLHLELPAHTEARLESSDLTSLQPTEYRADLVVVLRKGGPVFGIIVEVQLSPDEDKEYTWPVYVANLYARLECPVCLLVLTADDATARWAARPIYLGGENWFTPLVLGPSGVPIVTDESQARAAPELAVLSAMAHGRDSDIETSLRIAGAAQSATMDLDEDRSRLYIDLILHTLSEAARKAIHTMKPANYEFQSDFCRGLVALGKRGVIAQLLTLRFGPLSLEVQEQIEGASLSELDMLAQRLLTARTLQEAFQPS